MSNAVNFVKIAASSHNLKDFRRMLEHPRVYDRPQSFLLIKRKL